MAQLHLMSEQTASAVKDAVLRAEAAKEAAEFALSSFLKKYLGVKPADPSVDNSGGQLEVGAFYFKDDGVAPKSLRIFDGSAWNNIQTGYVIEAQADASNVSVATINGLLATNVQSALAEIMGQIEPSIVTEQRVTDVELSLTTLGQILEQSVDEITQNYTQHNLAIQNASAEISALNATAVGLADRISALELLAINAQDFAGQINALNLALSTGMASVVASVDSLDARVTVLESSQNNSAFIYSLIF